MGYSHLTYEICEFLSIDFRVGVLPILPEHLHEARFSGQELQSTFFFELIAGYTVFIIEAEELVASIGTKYCSTGPNISTQADHRSIDILILKQQDHHELWLWAGSWRLNRRLLGLFLFGVILLNLDQVLAFLRLRLLLLGCIHLADIFVALFDRVDQCQCWILPEIQVSEYDLVQVISQVVCCFRVGVSDALIDGEETELARIIYFGSCSTTLDDGDSVEVRLLDETSMCVDCIAHDHSFFIRKNILQSLLETRNCLFGTEWYIFFDVWEVLCQAVPCFQERSHLGISYIWILIRLFRRRLLFWLFAAVCRRLSWAYYLYGIAWFWWSLGTFNVLGVDVHHFLWNFNWSLNRFLRFLLWLFIVHIIWFWIRLNSGYLQRLLLVDLLLLFCLSILGILPNQLDLRIKQLLNDDDLLLRWYLRDSLRSSCVVIGAIQNVCLWLIAVDCLIHEVQLLLAIYVLNPACVVHVSIGWDWRILLWWLVVLVEDALLDQLFCLLCLIFSVELNVIEILKWLWFCEVGGAQYTRIILSFHGTVQLGPYLLWAWFRPLLRLHLLIHLLWLILQDQLCLGRLRHVLRIVEISSGLLLSSIILFDIHWPTTVALVPHILHGIHFFPLIFLLLSWWEFRLLATVWMRHSNWI